MIFSKYRTNMKFKGFLGCNWLVFGLVQSGSQSRSQVQGQEGIGEYNPRISPPVQLAAAAAQHLARKTSWWLLSLTKVTPNPLCPTTAHISVWPLHQHSRILSNFTSITCTLNQPTSPRLTPTPLWAWPTTAHISVRGALVINIVAFYQILPQLCQLQCRLDQPNSPRLSYPQPSLPNNCPHRCLASSSTQLHLVKFYPKCVNRNVD